MPAPPDPDDRPMLSEEQAIELALAEYRRQCGEPGTHFPIYASWEPRRRGRTRFRGWRVEIPLPCATMDPNSVSVEVSAPSGEATVAIII